MVQQLLPRRGKKRQVPVESTRLYRDLMRLYATLLRQGIGPRQIDETDMEDFFTMLECGGEETQEMQYIDQIMG